MSRLIKAQDPAAPAVMIHQALRPVAVHSPSTENVVSLEVLALRSEVEELSRRVEQEREQVDRLRTDAERLKGDVARALQEGEDRGRKAGSQQALQDRAALVKTLERAVKDGLAAHGEALQALDRLAPLLAREGLARVFDNPEVGGGLVAEVIRTQIQRLGAHSVLSIQVSAKDFPTQDELETLKTSSGAAGVVLAASDQLPSGDCRIRLTLGELEVGVGQQWGHLSALLLDLAEPGGVA